MKKALLGAVAAFTLMIGGAQAADLLGTGSSGSFDGFYLGGAGAYTFGEIGDLAIKGPSAGGFAGVGTTLSGTYYVGIEGALDYAWVKNKVAGIEVKRDVVGAVTARVGYLASPEILMYAQGGVVRARTKADAGAVAVKDWSNGIRAGVGLEQQYGDGLFGRVAVDADLFEHRQKSGAGKVGLGYRF